MEIWIGIVALLIAGWQLSLQRREIARATRLEMFKIAADIIRSEIALREKIIADEKAKPNKNWDGKIKPHVEKVNDVLRPALRRIERKIIEACGGEVGELKELPRHYVENEAGA